MEVSSFDLNQIKMNSVIFIIGESHSLIRNFLYQHQNYFDHTIAMTNSEHCRKNFEKYMPKSNISSIHTNGMIELIAEQKILTKNGIPRKTLFILQDYYGDDLIFQTQLLSDIVFKRRFLNLTLIISIPHCRNMISSHIRCQVDYCFVFQQTTWMDKRKLFHSFFGLFENFQSFEDVLNQCVTLEDESLVLDLSTSTTESLSDHIFHYKITTDEAPSSFMISSFEKYITNHFPILISCEDEIKKTV